MTDDASPEAAGAGRRRSAFCCAHHRRNAAAPRSSKSARGRAADGRKSSRRRKTPWPGRSPSGRAPVRDQRGWPLEVDFIAANGEAVEPWAHDPGHKRLYRRSQNLAKAAGQLIGQPGDRVEIAKRLALLHHREGSDIEGAVRRGLFDAIWRYDHVYDSFTVPRRYGTHFMKTGRVAAVAEERAPQMAGRGPGPGRCLLGAQPPQHRPGAGQPQSRSGGG